MKAPSPTADRKEEGRGKKSLKIDKNPNFYASGTGAGTSKSVIIE